MVDDERRRIRSLARPNTKEQGKHAATLQCLPSTSRAAQTCKVLRFDRFAFRFTTQWGAQSHWVVVSSVSRFAWLPCGLPHSTK